VSRYEVVIYWGNGLASVRTGHRTAASARRRARALIANGSVPLVFRDGAVKRWRWYGYGRQPSAWIDALASDICHGMMRRIEEVARTIYAPTVRHVTALDHIIATWGDHARP
jgi:hypothetical protein